MATRIDYGTMDDGTNTATVYLDDDAIMVIAQGDDETEELLHRFASHAEWAVKQTAAAIEAKRQQATTL